MLLNDSDIVWLLSQKNETSMGRHADQKPQNQTFGLKLDPMYLIQNGRIVSFLW